jgi:hypothetical protein
MSPLQLDINSLIEQAQTALIESPPVPVSHHDVEDLAAGTHPEDVAGRRFNVYALWSRKTAQSEWTLMYIGERHSAAGLRRLREHLFKVGKGTASKLEEVRTIVRDGAQMGVTVILIEPESLRLAIEEELLLLNSRYVGQLPWNKRGVTKLASRLPRDVANTPSDRTS